MPDFRMTDVDSSVIDHTSRSIDDDIKVLSAISTVLSAETMKNLNQYWNGPAKETFENEFILFSDTFQKLTEAYQNLNSKLKAAASTYGQADGSVKAEIQKMPK